MRRSTSLLRGLKSWLTQLHFSRLKSRPYRRQIRPKSEEKESERGASTKVGVSQSKKARNLYKVLKLSKRRVVILYDTSA